MRAHVGCVVCDSGRHQNEARRRRRHCLHLQVEPLSYGYAVWCRRSAVFVFSNRDKSSPVERDGLTWTPDELHLDLLASQYQDKPAMATVLALEGLEEYDPPNNGDIRRVNAMDESFIYHEPIRGWVQLSSGFCSA